MRRDVYLLIAAGFLCGVIFMLWPFIELKSELAETKEELAKTKEKLEDYEELYEYYLNAYLDEVFANWKLMSTMNESECCHYAIWCEEKLLHTNSALAECMRFCKGGLNDTQ
ncbi:hypothetical protein [Archaeoglobus sp.]